MAIKTLELKVHEVDKKTGVAVLLDPKEIDDVVKHEFFIPSLFGDPWPKAGEILFVICDTIGRFRIIDAYRPKQLTSA